MDTPDLDPEGLVEFRCTKCGLPLTGPLRELPEDDDFRYDNGEPLLPQCYFSWDDGHVVINVADRLNVRRVKHEDRLGGCCGMDGMDGPNTECINGHEVATEQTDCWMPHCLMFERDAVTQHAASTEVPSTAPVKRRRPDSKPIPWRPSRS